MLLMKMAEEGRCAHRLALQPVEALGLEEFGFGNRAEGSEKLLKDGARLLQHVGGRAILVSGINPGVDVVGLLQVRRSGRHNR